MKTFERKCKISMQTLKSLKGGEKWLKEKHKEKLVIKILANIADVIVGIY